MRIESDRMTDNRDKTNEFSPSVLVNALEL
jgi:hypothetical protein